MKTAETISSVTHRSTEVLFRPFSLKGLNLPNRVVMPAMGFHGALGGIPGPDVADFYARRAAGNVGLMFTEGVYIDHPVAGNNPVLMRFYGEGPLNGWGEVVRRVHAAGGRLVPELWHVGLIYRTEDVLKGLPPTFRPEEGQISPSGYIMPDKHVAEGMTLAQIDEVVESFARGAEMAKALGFDAVELHGAHGYLIDQFFWEGFNKRTDAYGGSIGNRARFAARIVAEIRRRVGADFPIIMRISQFKLQDYDAKVARNPAELEQWLSPLVEAGVDMFDCSQRRIWEPEYDHSPLNFAGWVKKVTGLPTISVGSVGLDVDMLASMGQATAPEPRSLDGVIEMMERGDFDLVAVGRSLLADPDWAMKVRSRDFHALIPFSPAIMAESTALKPYSGNGSDELHEAG